MNDQDFALLVESIQQAGAIKRGTLASGRTFEFSSLDGKAIRARLQKPQREFAQIIGEYDAESRTTEGLLNQFSTYVESMK